MGLQNFSSYNDLLTGGVYAISNYVSGTWAETGRPPVTETIGDLSWNTYQYRYEVFSSSNIYEQIAYVRENSITGTITGYSLYLNDLNVSNTVVSVGNTVTVSGTVNTAPPTGVTAVSGTVSVGNTVGVSGSVTSLPSGIQEISGSVTLAGQPVGVSGTVAVSQITSPVSVSGTTAVSGTVSIGNTVAVSGSVTAAASGTQDVNILTSAITIPVSGTVTATPTGTQAVSGSLTSVGSITSPISVSGTTAVSGSVTAIPTGTQDVNLLTSAITVPVSGAVTAIPTGTTTVSGTVSVGNTVAVSGSVTAAASGTQDVNILTSAITVPVSGSVTAIPTGTQAIEITGSAAMLNDRLKVGLPDSEISTTGTLVTKFCSINASSATRTEITSGTAVANANMPAQNIAYTVPAGKTFYLKQIWVEFDQTVTLARLVTFDLSSGAAASTIFHLITIARDSAGGLIANSHVFEKPLPIPAGTAIRVFVRTNGVNSAVWLKYSGVEV